MTSPGIGHIALTATTEPLLGAITIAGSGRLGPTLTALTGMIGVILSAVAYRRGRAGSNERTSYDRREAAAGLILGTISLVLGALFLLTADGGPGTGNGVVASVLALVLGPIAIALAGLSRVPLRKIDPIPPAQQTK